MTNTVFYNNDSVVVNIKGVRFELTEEDNEHVALHVLGHTFITATEDEVAMVAHHLKEHGLIYVQPRSIWEAEGDTLDKIGLGISIIRLDVDGEPGAVMTNGDTLDMTFYDSIEDVFKEITPENYYLY